MTRLWYTVSHHGKPQGAGFDTLPRVGKYYVTDSASDNFNTLSQNNIEAFKSRVFYLFSFSEQIIEIS
jgi:hypothetical protein